MTPQDFALQFRKVSRPTKGSFYYTMDHLNHFWYAEYYPGAIRGVTILQIPGTQANGKVVEEATPEQITALRERFFGKKK